jgi:hypothetical protein
MMSLAFKEGVKIPPPALNDIIEASDHDIRQVAVSIYRFVSEARCLVFIVPNIPAEVFKITCVQTDCAAR